MNAEIANVLELSLHDRRVGFLVGFSNGKNVLHFSEEFKSDPARPTFSLITHPVFPHADKALQMSWLRRQRLHPVLSNLLPEGSLRQLIAQRLKVHVDNEFQILSYLGADLPGAIVVTPVTPEQVPIQLLAIHANTRALALEPQEQENKFSLAGVQMKFSMKETDGRYNLSKDDVLGDWIVKTPSTQHQFVPQNEYTAMRLAEVAGVDMPEIRLVEISTLENLPPINLPDERWAFAIKRFDRAEGARVHMEDFAQVLVKYPHEKYSSANYAQIARLLNAFSGDALADIQQFARRLLVNILLGNGDEHLKNWSLVYPDKVTPQLSPAYDIVTTLAYIEGESRFALNLGDTKNWYQASLDDFQKWAKRSDIPWRAIKPHLDQTMALVRDSWASSLEDLPMNERHKGLLKQHWKNLHPDFSI